MRGRSKSSPFLNNELGLQEKLQKRQQLRKAHGRKTGDNKTLAKKAKEQLRIQHGTSKKSKKS